MHIYTIVIYLTIDQFQAAKVDTNCVYQRQCDPAGHHIGGHQVHRHLERQVSQQGLGDAGENVK